MAQRFVDDRDATVTTISHGDLVKMYASSAAKALSMKTSQFYEAWQEGKLDEVLQESDHPDLVRWAMLMSFGRQQPS